MRAIQCDRCGKYGKKDKEWKSLCGDIISPYPKMGIDLCETCVKEFKRWLACIRL